MGKLKISVVTVCYNAVNVIEKTIQSVINQTYNNIEYIIVDGASTDGTVDIIRKYENYITKWISEPDKGIYDAMNKGIVLAAGDYINFMNAGDCFSNDKTCQDVQIAINKDNFVSDIYFGDVLRKKGEEIKYAPAEPISVLRYRMPFCHQSCFVKIDVMKHHLYDVDYKIAADFNLFHSLFVHDYLFSHINKTISIYDAENGLSSKRYLQANKEMIKIICHIRYKTWLVDALYVFMWSGLIYFKNLFR